MPGIGLQLLLLCLSGGAVEAQTAPTARADVTVTAGWMGLDTGVPRLGNDDWDGTLSGGVSAGWYWTDHVKTEIEIGAAGEAEGFGSEVTRIDGRDVHRLRRSTLDRRAIGVMQQFQYGRNAWFHPHVAAGISVAFDTRMDHYEPAFGYDPVTRRSHVIEPARTEGPIRTTTVRPFLAGGFKAYLTPRVFVRTDVRAGGGGATRGIDELIARVGLGIDF